MIFKGKDLSYIPLCKVTNEEEIHRGFKYKVGKNTDTNKYGLHFVTCEDVFHPEIRKFGNGYRKITVDDDEYIDCHNPNFDYDTGYSEEYEPITFSAKSITLLPGKQKFSDITDEKEVIQMVKDGYYGINKDNWYNTKICYAALTNSYMDNYHLYNNYFSDHCKNDLSILKKLKESGVDIGRDNSIKVFLSKFRSEA